MSDLSSRFLNALSDLCQLLSRFLFCPDRMLSEALWRGDVAADARAILKELGAADLEIEAAVEGLEAGGSAPVDNEESLFHSVRRDYTHLFSNPSFSVVRVYESEFLSEHGEEQSRSPLLNAVAREAADRYGRLDESLWPATAEQADHMGLELRYMQVLCQGWAAARSQGDEESAGLIGEEVRSFSETHLDRWAAPFFAQVQQCANEPVYRAIGRIGDKFVRAVHSAGIAT